MKRIASALLVTLLICILAACSKQPAEPTGTPASPPDTPDPGATPDSSAPPEPTPEREPYLAMDLFGAKFNPFGMDWPCTVFEASFDKGSDKLEGKSRFVLSMTGEGNMYAYIAYQADVAGLGLDEGGKGQLVDEYRNNGEFLEFTGADGRVVTIRKADPNDTRYAYVEADGAHGFTGGGCVIDISFYVDEADVEKYTQLVQDNYNLNALSPIAAYFDTATEFSECGISVNLHRNAAKTYVVYYLPDTEAIRQNIAENVESEWWEWYSNLETYIAYDNAIGNKLIFAGKGGAVTVEQTNQKFNEPPAAEGSLFALGFGFDDAGTCGVYEDRDGHYKSVAIARPEWGEFPDDWNIEFMDTDIKGFSLRITYYADEGRYQISLDKDGESCCYDNYPQKYEFGGESPDLETVHRMFNDAFGTKEKELYFAPLAYFEQYVQEHFGMSVDQLYKAPKQQK